MTWKKMERKSSTNSPEQSGEQIRGNDELGRTKGEIKAVPYMGEMTELNDTRNPFILMVLYSDIRNYLYGTYLYGTYTYSRP